MILAFNAWDTILLSGLRLFCVLVCLEVFKQVLSHYKRRLSDCNGRTYSRASSSSYNLISNKQQPSCLIV
jgi:hypothetical protein